MAKGSRDPFADQFTEAMLTPESTPKRLALLKETLLEAARVAVLWDPGYVSHGAQMAALEATARGLGVALQGIAIRRPADLDGAFVAMRRGETDALLVLTSTMLQYHVSGIAERALTSRIPAMGELREFPAAGGLMSDGPSPADRHEQAVGNVDELRKKLKREPSDLPRARSRKLDMVINLKTAKTLGLTIPQSVLIRTDEVIQ